MLDELADNIKTTLTLGHAHFERYSLKVNDNCNGWRQVLVITGHEFPTILTPAERDTLRGKLEVMFPMYNIDICPRPRHICNLNLDVWIGMCHGYWTETCMQRNCKCHLYKLLPDSIEHKNAGFEYKHEGNMLTVTMPSCVANNPYFAEQFSRNTWSYKFVERTWSNMFKFEKYDRSHEYVMFPVIVGVCIAALALSRLLSDHA